MSDCRQFIQIIQFVITTFRYLLASPPGCDPFYNFKFQVIWLLWIVIDARPYASERTEDVRSGGRSVTVTEKTPSAVVTGMRDTRPFVASGREHAFPSVDPQLTACSLLIKACIIPVGKHSFRAIIERNSSRLQTSHTFKLPAKQSRIKETVNHPLAMFVFVVRGYNHILRDGGPFFSITLCELATLDRKVIENNKIKFKNNYLLL